MWIFISFWEISSKILFSLKNCQFVYSQCFPMSCSAVERTAVQGSGQLPVGGGCVFRSSLSQLVLLECRTVSDSPSGFVPQFGARTLRSALQEHHIKTTRARARTNGRTDRQTAAASEREARMLPVRRGDHTAVRSTFGETPPLAGGA